MEKKTTKTTTTRTTGNSSEEFMGNVKDAFSKGWEKTKETARDLGKTFTDSLPTEDSFTDIYDDPKDSFKKTTTTESKDDLTGKKTTTKTEEKVEKKPIL